MVGGAEVALFLVAERLKYMRGPSLMQRSPPFTDAALTEADDCNYPMGNCLQRPQWPHSRPVTPTTHAGPP